MEAAKLLNISEDGYYNALGGISNREIGSLEANEFTPMTISNKIYAAFEANAEKIGTSNPLEAALDAIIDLQDQMSQVSLSLPSLPVFENPLLPIMQETPITPTSLNLPSIDAQLVSQQVNPSNYNNLTTQQKIALLFG